MQKVTAVRRGYVVPRGRLVRLASAERRAYKDPPVPRVSVAMGRQVRVGPKDSVDWQGRPGRKVCVDSKGRPGRKDSVD